MATEELRRSLDEALALDPLSFDAISPPRYAADLTWNHDVALLNDMSPLRNADDEGNNNAALTTMVQTDFGNVRVTSSSSPSAVVADKNFHSQYPTASSSPAASKHSSSPTNNNNNHNTAAASNKTIRVAVKAASPTAATTAATKGIIPVTQSSSHHPAKQVHGIATPLSWRAQRDDDNDDDNYNSGDDDRSSSRSSRTSTPSHSVADRRQRYSNYPSDGGEPQFQSDFLVVAIRNDDQQAAGPTKQVTVSIELAPELARERQRQSLFDQEARRRRNLLLREVTELTRMLSLDREVLHRLESAYHTQKLLAQVSDEPLDGQYDSLLSKRARRVKKETLLQCCGSWKRDYRTSIKSSVSQKALAVDPKRCHVELAWMLQEDRWAAQVVERLREGSEVVLRTCWKGALAVGPRLAHAAQSATSDTVDAVMMELNAAEGEDEGSEEFSEPLCDAFTAMGMRLFRVSEANPTPGMSVSAAITDPKSADDDGNVVRDVSSSLLQGAGRSRLRPLRRTPASPSAPIEDPIAALERSVASSSVSEATTIHKVHPSNRRTKGDDQRQPSQQRALQPSPSSSANTHHPCHRDRSLMEDYLHGYLNLLIAFTSGCRDIANAKRSEANMARAEREALSFAETTQRDSTLSDESLAFRLLRRDALNALGHTRAQFVINEKNRRAMVNKEAVHRLRMYEEGHFSVWVTELVPDMLRDGCDVLARQEAAAWDALLASAEKNKHHAERLEVLHRGQAQLWREEAQRRVRLLWLQEVAFADMLTTSRRN